MASQIDVDAVAGQGYTIVRRVMDDATLAMLGQAVSPPESHAPDADQSPNARRLLETCPAVADLAESPAIRQIVEPVLGRHAFPVRGLLFDKVPGANWRVGWHQDLMIPVAAKFAMPGYTSWSVKQGVEHVCPPAEILQGMLTLRVHLDNSPADNGPLEVLPGTHRLRKIAEGAIREVVAGREAVVCTANAGDVLAMRPLLLHASRRSVEAAHRRVVHLEFAAEPLPKPLTWHRPLELSD